MIVNVTELGRGDILEIDGDPWQATEVQSQTPSARGASLLIKAKVKNLRTGQTLAKTWRGGETVTTAEVDYRQAQYLYRQGDDFVFMDLASYEQTTLDVAEGRRRRRLPAREPRGPDGALPGPGHRAQPAALRGPRWSRTRCPRSRARPPRRSSSRRRSRPGSPCMVPAYVETGEKIRVDTRDGRFVERAK